jgi:hypothetical protein
MKLTNPKSGKGEHLLGVSFKASTFSAIPESELAEAATAKTGKKGGAKAGAKAVKK